MTTSFAVFTANKGTKLFS